MQKIAFERMGTWFSEAWSEYTAGFSNLLPWGALVFGLAVIQNVISQIAGAFGQFSEIIMAITVVLSVILGFVVQGMSQVILAGISLARWHGREAYFSDVKQDLNTHIQGILTMLTGSVLAGILAMIAAIPGGAAIGLAFASGTNDPNPVLIILGILLILILVLPVAIIFGTLIYFAIPLVVDKRLDFWSALMQSMDCIRRDLLGLMVFFFVYGLCYGLSAICTCGFAVIFLSPFFGLLLTRAYRDYFGLGEDRMKEFAPAPQWQFGPGAMNPPPQQGQFGPPQSPAPPQPYQQHQPWQSSDAPPGFAPGGTPSSGSNYPPPPNIPGQHDDQDRNQQGGGSWPPPPPPPPPSSGG